MKTALASSLLVLVLASAGAAFAAAPATATLAAPVAKGATVVAGGGLWRCLESTCTLSSGGSVDMLQACHQLVQKVGQVTAIGSEKNPFTPERLARCNAAK